MKVAVSSNGDGLDAQLSPIFGRCAYLTLVDTDTLEATTIPNPAVGAPGGAGIQAAQFVVGEGAEAVVSGNVGPNAMQVLQAAGVPVYAAEGCTVREAIAALQEGTLRRASGPTVAADYGKGGLGAGGRGAGFGRGMGRGGGRGRGFRS